MLIASMAKTKALQIIFTIKQVPDTHEVRIDPKTNSLIREGIPSIVNPEDKNAVEAALILREKHGGTITVLTMGPPQAEEVLTEVIAMGADRGILLTDRAFAGADTLVTAFTLSRAIRKLGKFDLILCGRQAIDGDTAQVGPQLAGFLNLNQITYAQKVLLPDPEVIAIRSELLHADLMLLEAVEQRLLLLEKRFVDLVAQTPYQIWTQLKGLSDLQVARLAASIGDPDHYTHAKQVFRRSGLVSGRNDSGVRQNQGKGSPVVKTGDVHLRRALMDIISTFILHQPLLYSYYTKLKLSKPDLVARVATARRATGILWATLRDQYSTTLVYKQRGEPM